MRGTNERRSIVDEGWEPIKPERGRLAPLLIVCTVALVVIPLAAFFATYMLMSR